MGNRIAKVNKIIIYCFLYFNLTLIGQTNYDSSRISQLIEQDGPSCSRSNYIPDEYQLKKKYQPLLYFKEYFLDSLYYELYYNNERVCPDSIKFTLLPAYEVGTYKFDYMTQKEYIANSKTNIRSNNIYDVFGDTTAKDIFCSTQFNIYYHQNEYIFLFPCLFDDIRIQFKILTSIFYKDPTWGYVRPFYKPFSVFCLIPCGDIMYFRSRK